MIVVVLNAMMFFFVNLIFQIDNVTWHRSPSRYFFRYIRVNSYFRMYGR